MSGMNGEVAYEAYRKHSGGKSLVSGSPIPNWSELSGEIQDAWDAAGMAVNQEFEGIISVAESAANMLRGMTLDPNISAYAKGAMREKIQELETEIEKHV